MAKAKKIALLLAGGMFLLSTVLWAETATIMSEGREVRVVRRCTLETPTLQPLGDDPTHCHACLLRQQA